MSNFERQINLHRRSPAPGRDDGRNNEFSKVVDLLSPYADIKLPKDAPHPIFSPSVKMAIAELKESIQAAEELKSVKAVPPKTVLLEGPPGTGKTSMAHFFAAWLRLPLVLVRSESLVDSYLGATGKNLAALFKAMEQTQGECIIFIDEIDAIGSKRESGGSAASREMASSLTVLLRKIEQFNGIFFAATNRVDALDKALVRRFDMQVHIGLPDLEDIFSIILMYADPFAPCDDDVDMMAELLAGSSPSTIKKLVEGIKRSSVLWPKIRREEPTAVDIVSHVLTSVSPASEAEKMPPLWADKHEAFRRLENMEWPWPRRGEDA